MASVQAAKHGTEWPVNPSIATIIFIKDLWRPRPRSNFLSEKPCQRRLSSKFRAFIIEGK